MKNKNILVIINNASIPSLKLALKNDWISFWYSICQISNLRLSNKNSKIIYYKANIISLKQDNENWKIKVFYL